MPFHTHHGNNSNHPHTPGAMQALSSIGAQALGSIGAPTGNLRTATAGTTTAGTDILLSSNSNTISSAPPSSLGLSQPHSVAPAGGPPQQQHQFETPRRAPTLGRGGHDELHLRAGDGSAAGAAAVASQHQPQSSQQQNQQQQQQQTHQHQQATAGLPQHAQHAHHQLQHPQQQQHQQQPSTPQQQQPPPPQQQQQAAGALYSQPSMTTPALSVQQATPQSSHFQTPTTASNTQSVPGALQAGAGRPPPGSYPSAPASAPNVPHISTNAQQYTSTLPVRSNTMNTSHAYSRSSPAGLEQGSQSSKYIPFNQSQTQLPGQGQPQPTSQPSSAHTPTQKYYSPQTPAAPSQSPLGLEHIRPRANSSLEDTGLGLGYGEDKIPGNSSYIAPWPVYAFDWCKWPVQGQGAGKIAVGSYLEDPHHFIQILDTQITPTSPPHSTASPFSLSYTRIAEATCSYPVTRIFWEPPSSSKSSTDLLATSGDHLRLWSLPNTTGQSPHPQSNTISRSASVNTKTPPPAKLTPLALLSNSKTPEHTAPLTSLDWNTLSPKLIITSSIDTTCTIWDIPTLTAKTQLIAHDKEVYDVRFCAGSVDVFVSCGADGSVRMFDLRSLEHSTIIYEPSDKVESSSSTGKESPPSPTKGGPLVPPPLLRLAASPHDAHLLATFADQSNTIRILDVRQPGQALLELRGHSANVNAIEWSPSRRGMLASGSDDSLVLVWDLLNSSNGAVVNGLGENGGAGFSGQGHGHTGSGGGVKGPAASWRCDYEVGNLSWAPQSGLTAQGGEWVGVAGGRGIWGVKL